MYVDANVPAGLVAFMRNRLQWDVLFVIEHDDLRRARDGEHYRRADGSLSPKVFKWTRAELLPGEEAGFVKRPALREVTTRRHYPGAHKVAVQVNGTVVAEAGFDLAL